jgi:glyceraldehyde-3-phosphate dehydrogenase/erythrose-4-phosphate dehydrogenase
VDPDQVCYGEGKDHAYIEILNQKIQLTSVDSIKQAANELADVDVVVCAIGEMSKDTRFMNDLLQTTGAKAILLTCETPAADIHMIPGFNHDLVNPQQHRKIALGSCTGNCAVPILAVIEDEFGEGAIRGVYAMTAHSKTNTQEIGNKGVDPKKEGILGNLIPTTTGLAKLLQYPGFFGVMSGSLEAVSVRTPTEDASLLGMIVDIETDRELSTASIRNLFRSASEAEQWRGIIRYDRAHGTKLLWRDTHACVIYDSYVKFLPKKLRNGQRAPISSISVMAAYANVHGYACQVARGILALRVGRESRVSRPHIGLSLELNGPVGSLKVDWN